MRIICDSFKTECDGTYLHHSDARGDFPLNEETRMVERVAMVRLSHSLGHSRLKAPLVSSDPEVWLTRFYWSSVKRIDLPLLLFHT